MLIELDSWQAFKTRLDGYLGLPRARREQYIFRGQTDSQWTLKPVLDRVREFVSEGERSDYLESLVKEFRREAYGLPFDTRVPSTDIQWELLARHHGLPTTILDWTTSPYIAAYFAFAIDTPPDAPTVAIWMLDRDIFRRTDIPHLEVLDDLEAVAVNPRAIEQRAAFLRVGYSEETIEDLLEGFLFRFEIPLEQARMALEDLDAMRLNARNLFRDLDSAASTAARRILG